MVQQHCTLQHPLGVNCCLSFLDASKQDISYCTCRNARKGVGDCTLLPVSIKLHQLHTMPCTRYSLLLELYNQPGPSSRATFYDRACNMPVAVAKCAPVGACNFAKLLKHLISCKMSP